MKLRDFKNEIKVLDIGSLLSRAKALKVEIDDLVLDKNMSKLKDIKSIFKKKKDLARVLTVLNQKEMIEKLEAGSRDKQSLPIADAKGQESSKKANDKEEKKGKK